jgi:hypothetical protein
LIVTFKTCRVGNLLPTRREASQYIRNYHYLYVFLAIHVFKVQFILRDNSISFGFIARGQQIAHPTG